MSYEELRNYLDLLKDQTGIFEVRVDWSVIKPEEVGAHFPAKRMGLQIAGAIAGSFFYAVQKTQHGFTEDRYAKMLKPVVYNRNGRYLGYGLKLWPREVDKMLKSDTSLQWMVSEYK